MGIIGDLNEPMLNFTVGLINSRAEINIQPETLEFVDDNFKFDFLKREMYIENKEVKIKDGN